MILRGDFTQDIYSECAAAVGNDRDITQIVCERRPIFGVPSLYLVHFRLFITVSSHQDIFVILSNEIPQRSMWFSMPRVTTNLSDFSFKTLIESISR